jgi:hypothetical protein
VPAVSVGDHPVARVPEPADALGVALALSSYDVAAGRDARAS